MCGLQPDRAAATDVEFALLVSDVDVPECASGIALARDLGLRTLLISGTPGRTDVPPGYRLLPKPFSVSQLLEAVSELLSPSGNGIGRLET